MYCPTYRYTTVHTVVYTSTTRVHTVLQTSTTHVHTVLQTSTTPVPTVLHTSTTPVHTVLHTTPVHTVLHTTPVHSVLHTGTMLHTQHPDFGYLSNGVCPVMKMTTAEWNPAGTVREEWRCWCPPPSLPPPPTPKHPPAGRVRREGIGKDGLHGGHGDGAAALGQRALHAAGLRQHQHQVNGHLEQVLGPRAVLAVPRSTLQTRHRGAATIRSATTLRKSSVLRACVTVCINFVCPGPWPFNMFFPVVLFFFFFFSLIFLLLLIGREFYGPNYLKC